MRTSQRTLKGLQEKQLEWLNDETYVHLKNEKKYYLKRYTSINPFQKAYYTVMSYIIANYSMSMVLEKCDKILKTINNNIPVIKPYQKGKVLWDIIILFTIVFFFYLIPLQLSFDFYYDELILERLEINNFNPNISKLIVFLPELLLILDSLLKFITGYYQNGVVITNKKKIFLHYLKKGFIFDILSYSPIIAQTFLKGSMIGGVLLKFFQLLMFFKIKRVQIIMTNFQVIISLNGKHDHILNLINLIYQIIFYTHIMACVWHGVAFYYQDEGVLTWLDFNNLRETDWFRRYLFALYWAVSVMVTVSNEFLTPHNNLEMGIGVFILLISSLFFGFTLNSMREIFELMGKSEKDYKENLSIVNYYMKRNNINFELQGRVRKYLEYLMKKESNTQKEGEILNSLTQSLKSEVILQSNGKLLDHIPFLKTNFSKDTIEGLSFCLKKCRYSPEEFIYRMNELDECSLFILADGSLEYTIPIQQGIRKINDLHKGEIFGLFSFFNGEPRKTSVRSKDFSTILEIKKNDFLNIVKKNPQDYEQYCMMRDRIKLYFKYEDIQSKCICCNKEKHNIINCPLLHYVPDTDFLIKRNNFTKPQERNTTFIRSNKKKYNARSQNHFLINQLLKLNSEFFSDNDSLIIDENENDVILDLVEKTQNSQIISEKDLDFSKGIRRFPTKNYMYSHSQINSISEMDEDNSLSPRSPKSPNSPKSPKAKLYDNKQEFTIMSNIASGINQRTPKAKSMKRMKTSHHMQKSEFLFSDTKLKPLIMKKDEFYLFDFDKGRNYITYFPHNNLQNVVSGEKRRSSDLNFDTKRRKHSVRKKFMVFSTLGNWKHIIKRELDN